MKKLTCKQVRYLEADEKKASKEYASYGFGSFAKDEARHGRFFSMLRKEKGCK